MELIVHGSCINELIPKNSCSGKMGHFDLGPRMSHPASQLWIVLRKDCFTILHNERDQERHGNYINGFSLKRSYSYSYFWRKTGT